MPLIFAFVLGMSFLLLLVVFHSIVIPIKAIVLNLLSAGAAYGVVVAVFQDDILHGAFGIATSSVIESWVPIFIFTILFGLSMDYHVFILTRVKEARDRGLDSRAAVARGIAITVGHDHERGDDHGRGVPDLRDDPVRLHPGAGPRAGGRGPDRRDDRPQRAAPCHDDGAGRLELVAAGLPALAAAHHDRRRTGGRRRGRGPARGRSRLTPGRPERAAILRPMSPLARSTIATVGSGVMAEAMIAGLLRGRLVEPSQVIASHPRSERREALERDYAIRTVSSNVEAVEAADVILLGIKPQMLSRVGARSVRTCVTDSSCLSVLAGATTAALTGLLGHDQVVRSMPNTPARLGKGMTVWYATPETTETQRAQAAALLGALGHEIEVDDEKMVAMATAVSGTGPTYVFLVMEALIDAAVHLGFPRHIAHDLVIETLEGSTLFAKSSGMHPAELRNMVTSPGGTSAAALHELESGRLRTVLSEAVWAAYRRTVELGDQLEASVGSAAGAPAGSAGSPAGSAGGSAAGSRSGGR